MRDVTLGQYYPSDSILHRLDARVKFLGTLIYIVALFLVKGTLGYVFMTAVLLTLMVLTRVPFRIILGGLKPLTVILVVTVLFNLLLTPGDEIFRFGFISITVQGVQVAVRMAMRLMYLVLGSSLMTLTTTPNQLTDGMEKLFAPLSRIHVPVHEIAMMMSIALRFIPILMEETDKIRQAQIARGADFESGSFLRRLKAMIPLLVPLFVSAFRRANDLAMAMESRCYHGGDGRTQMKPLRYAARDYTAYAVLLVLLGISIFFRICGASLPGGKLI